MMTAVPAPRESHVRSLVKGISWRIVATLTTMVIAYAVTGAIDLALQIGFIEVGLKILIYYLHERAWAAVPLGALRAPGASQGAGEGGS